MESKKGQEISPQSQQTTDESNKTTAELDVRVELFTNVNAKESTKEEPGASTSRAESTKFQDPFSFVSDMWDTIGESSLLMMACYSMLVNFLDGRISEDLYITKMKLIFKEPSDLMSGLRLFLKTPTAVSSIRAQVNDDTLLSQIVGLQFGYRSKRFDDYIRLIELYENSDSDVNELDNQLEALFEGVNDDLKKAVKERLKKIRDFGV